MRAVTDILRHRVSRLESIFDIGCGDGFVGQSLIPEFHVRHLVGVDIHLQAEQCGISEQAGCLVERHRTYDTDEQRRFEAVLALDVLEHVPDDAAFLTDVVRRRLAPRGYVLLMCPALQVLFSNHDRALSHYRRYNLAMLRGVAAQAGLDLLDSGYIFGALLVPRAVAKLLESLGRPQPDYGAGRWEGGPLLTQALATALTLDARVLTLLSRAGLPVPGLTAWALCRAR